MKEPKRIHLSDFRPPEISIERTELTFRLDDNQTKVTSRLHISKTPHFTKDLTLDAEELQIIEIKIDGRPLTAADFLYDSNKLNIHGPLPDRFLLETSCVINPSKNHKLEGLYKSGDVFCTQMESEGFRRVTPYLDRPDVLSRFSTRIEADAKKYPQLLSNGNLIEKGLIDEKLHYALWEDPTLKPCYLFALVAADLAFIQDHFCTASGREVRCEVYVDKGNEGRAQHALDSLMRAMRWDEHRFGLEYDLDLYMIVAVDAFNFGAMENKGLNIFNSSAVLADPDTATDEDYRRIEAIVAHEYFHNWTGNRITCRDWFQLTLKEGLTVFRDQEFSADTHDRAAFRIQEVNQLRERQFLEDSGPNAHPIKPSSYIEINNFYTATVYEKGAEVIRMIHTLVGPKGFRKGMDLYFSRHDGQAVCTEDFVSAMADANSISLRNFEAAWYHQAGTPRLLFKGNHDAVKQTYTLDLEQILPDEAGDEAIAYTIPVRIALLDGDGENIDLQLNGNDLGTETVLTFAELRASYVFENVKHKPCPSLMRQFSAPLIIENKTDLSESLLRWAIENDDFNRYEIGQDLAHQQIEAISNGNGVDALYLQNFRQLLLSPMTHSIKAEMISLPSLSQVLERSAVYDPKMLDEARRHLMSELLDFCHEEFTELYHRLARSDDRGMTTLDMGRRALRNTCLQYICSSDNKESAQKQYREAANMTDRMAALTQLMDADKNVKQAALADFSDRYQGDSVVMNKWFALQASASSSDLLDELEALESHPAYNHKNPNKIRALIGGLIKNLVAFHAKDGSGYAFLAERIASVDTFNAGIAAGLARAFAKYPSLDEQMAKNMAIHIKGLLARPKLSRDVYEILSNTLKSRVA